MNEKELIESGEEKQQWKYVSTPEELDDEPEYMAALYALDGI